MGQWQSTVGVSNVTPATFRDSDPQAHVDSMVFSCLLSSLRGVLDGDDGEAEDMENERDLERHRLIRKKKVRRSLCIEVAIVHVL